MRCLTLAARAAWSALAAIALTRASTVQTYTDANCTQPKLEITVDNSTGSGECTSLKTGYKSFMITSLGKGCSVTIYGKDGDEFCSASNNSIATDQVCYDSEWIFFSVDECAKQQTSSTLLPTTSATTSVSTSTVSTSVTTTPTISPPTQTAPVSSSKDTTNIGAIVGGTVSGVFVVSVVTGTALFFFWFRPRQERKKQELTQASAHAPDDHDHDYNPPPGETGLALSEMGGGKDSDHYYYPSPSTAGGHKSPPLRSPSEAPGDMGAQELPPHYISEVHENPSEIHEMPASYHQTAYENSLLTRLDSPGSAWE
ncbi:hypothetical protein GGR57DRAFT_505558 [Xylariaceae sp. FL1272]|nr:hypothetical protein GGR57DRAFT_505558 [Xylariaceae sp. FL1272]